MARKRNDPNQPDLFSILDGAGGDGDRSGDPHGGADGVLDRSGPARGVDGPSAHEFITAEAAKISSMAASMAETLWEQAITAWSRHRNGQTPNHATKVALLEAARKQAAQTVLNNELYELIATDENDPRRRGRPPTRSWTRAQVGWAQRWTNPAYQSEPTEDLEALIDRLWPAPDFSGPFRIKAGYLLAARAEDGLIPPAHHEDPLTAELAQMIYSDLRTDGLPER